MTAPGKSITSGDAQLASRPLADAQIGADFCFRKEDHGTRHFPPPQVKDVSQRVLSAFECGRTETILAPALGDVGAALVVKSVASVLGQTPRLQTPGRPQTVDEFGRPVRDPLLILYSETSDLQVAYHQIKDPGLDPFAERCPLMAPGSSPAKAGFTRSNPVWWIQWASQFEDLPTLAKSFPGAKVLILAERPGGAVTAEEVPSVIVYLNPLPGGATLVPSGPNLVAVPPAAATGDSSSTNPLLANALQRWKNAADPRLEMVEIHASVTICRFYEAMRRFRRTAAAAQLGISDTIEGCYRRTMAYVLPPGTQRPAAGSGPAVESLLSFQRALMDASGAAADTELAHLLQSAEDAVNDLRAAEAQKLGWLRETARALPTEGRLVLVLPDRHEVAAWNENVTPRGGELARVDAVLPTYFWRQTTSHHAIVPFLPARSVVEKLLCGGAASCSLLLYPWELGPARRRLSWFATTLARSGLSSWPPQFAKSPPELPPTDLEEDEVELVEGIEPVQTGGVTEGGLAIPNVVDDTAPIRRYELILEGAERQVLYEGQTVIAKRQGSFESLPVEDVRKEDLVVVQQGRGSIGAHQLLERLCRNIPEKAEALQTARAWRDILRQWIGQRYAGWKVSAIVENAKPPCTVTAFRNWFAQDEPLTPTPRNLKWLYEWMGLDPSLAEVTLGARERHIEDRREIYRELLHASEGAYDELLAAAEGGLGNNKKVRTTTPIPLDDMRRVVSFKKVLQVRAEVVNHSRGPSCP